jgi:hypothetical protein
MGIWLLTRLIRGSSFSAAPIHPAHTTVFCLKGLFMTGTAVTGCSWAAGERLLPIVFYTLQFF